ncbi:MAG: heme exporter protein CcmD [Kangiellaceae bacterium]|nr:heme exporter protein CcmD [Kangiellaceae bacterium]
MYFESFEDFIAMGGHGFYVWISYGVAFVALIAYFMLSKRQAAKNILELKKFYLQIEQQASLKNDVTVQ